METSTVAVFFFTLEILFILALVFSAFIAVQSLYGYLTQPQPCVVVFMKPGGTDACTLRERKAYARI